MLITVFLFGHSKRPTIERLCLVEFALHYISLAFETICKENNLRENKKKLTCCISNSARALINFIGRTLGLFKDRLARIQTVLKKVAGPRWSELSWAFKIRSHIWKALCLN